VLVYFGGYLGFYKSLNFKACALEIVGVITYFETLHKYTKKNTKYKIHLKKQKVGKIKIKYTLGRKT